MWNPLAVTEVTEGQNIPKRSPNCRKIVTVTVNSQAIETTDFCFQFYPNFTVVTEVTVAAFRGLYFCIA